MRHARPALGGLTPSAARTRRPWPVRAPREVVEDQQDFIEMIRERLFFCDREPRSGTWTIVALVIRLEQLRRHVQRGAVARRRVGDLPGVAPCQ